MLILLNLFSSSVWKFNKNQIQSKPSLIVSYSWAMPHSANWWNKENWYEDWTCGAQLQLSLGSIAVTCVTQTRHTSLATAHIAHEDFKTEIFSLKSNTLRINRSQIEKPHIAHKQIPKLKTEKPHIAHKQISNGKLKSHTLLVNRSQNWKQKSHKLLMIRFQIENWKDTHFSSTQTENWNDTYCS